MRPLAILGNLSSDRVGERPPRVGGAPFHSARALHVIGTRGRILARCAEVDRERLLRPLVALGVPVDWRPSASTTSFSFHYEDERRIMAVDAVGEPWTPQDVKDWVLEAVRGCEWVHLGALSRSDFPAETVAALARRHRVSLDGQGLVRVPEPGPLILDADFDPAVLRHVTILKLAEEEAHVLDAIDARGLRRLGVPEVVVTLGSRGSLVYAGGSITRVPSRPARGTVDPTGAGDAFTASYLAARRDGQPPAAAAHRAGVVVSGLLAGRVK